MERERIACRLVRQGLLAIATSGALLLGGGCAEIDLDPPPRVIHARFDPDAKVIPMPTNVLRDEVTGHLDVPLDGDITDAEREFYTYLNTLEGWSTTMAATVEFTAPVDAATLTAQSVQVWQAAQGAVTTPRRIEDVTITAEPTKLTIDPPRAGWERGATYFVLVRGGSSGAGAQGKQGEPVECDAAFYFLRQTQKLDTPAHERAFPGKTRAERMDNARKLEEIRLELQPYFEHFARGGIPRADVAALWSFTVTTRTELAMDKVSQRMPLPINLLLDPATGKVDLPAASWDSQTVKDAKLRLRDMDGFALSAGQMFGFTAPIDPATVTPATVELWQAGPAPRKVAADLRVLADKLNVIVEPKELLAEKTRYVVVVRRGLRDAAGKPVVTMPLGHLMQASRPVWDAGKSLVRAVADADAQKVERVRGEVHELLATLPEASRADVLTAWSFTTLSVTEPLMAAVGQAERLNVPVEPGGIVHQTPGQALADFALAIASQLYVGEVIHGTIASPVFLDKTTRGLRTDGGHEVQRLAFTMTLPRNLRPDKPVPVVIFGHAIMTEHRFVLAVADALAQRGYAAISIDWPFHGERTYCWSEGPLTVPDPRTGKLTGLDPCQAGSRCMPDGRCVATDGSSGNKLAKWPVIGMNQASGAAFLEIEHIANTRDHFWQSLVDVAALARSLRKADWKSVIGAPIKTDEILYAGQSLGSIIGATYVALDPGIKRAVLNVPGADTVDMFEASPFFSGQVAAFFRREGVDRRSFDGERFMNVARWFIDSVDPQGVADRLGKDGRKVMIQMATLDAIIPNAFTQVLVQRGGVPKKDYTAEHAFLVIPVEPEFLRGNSELASFLATGVMP